MLPLVIFLCVFTLLAVILLIKINIVIEYDSEKFDDNLVVSFFALKKLVKIKYEIPILKISGEGIKFRKIRKMGKDDKKAEESREKKSFGSIYDKVDSFKKFYQINRKQIFKVKCYLKKKLTINEFALIAEIGTKDPYITGVGYGLAWAVTGIITSYIFNNFKTAKRNIDIKANFKTEKLSVNLFCIFGIRVVNIIMVGIKILIMVLRIRLSKKNNTKECGGDLVV